MASRTAAQSPADPATESFMQDIGRIPLLTHREEQECGIRTERQKYLAELHAKARFPKAPHVAVGILRRIARQKNLIFVLAGAAGLPPDPRLSDLAGNAAFRDLVDLKPKETTIRQLKQQTKPNSRLHNEAELCRRMTQVSKDTACLTAQMIESAGNCTVAGLAGVLQEGRVMERLRESRERLDQELREFAAQAKLAQDKLAESNMRLVVSIANNYSNGNIPLQDLAQEGSIGLIDASQRYDHRLGWKFSTYATHWIHHRITKAVAKQSRVIRIPENKHKLARDVYFTRNDLAQELGREPEDVETAARLNIDLELLQHIDRIDHNPDSLDELMFDGDTTTKAERVASTGPGPEEVSIGNMLRPDLMEALNFLPRKERAVIKMRYGLDDDVKCTFSEIAKTLKTDRDQVREMEKNAIRKLQKNPKVIAILREYI